MLPRMHVGMPLMSKQRVLYILYAEHQIYIHRARERERERERETQNPFFIVTVKKCNKHKFLYPTIFDRADP